MIGDVLKRTRIIYGYKASEMSSELGISASYLSEIENNKKQPSLELLQKYADIYCLCQKHDGTLDTKYVCGSR